MKRSPYALHHALHHSQHPDPCRMAATSGLLATVVLTAVALACAQADTGAQGGKRAARPANIVILFADDLGYGDLSSYGHPSIETPQLDRLAREGQRWTDFYVAAPVCSPSRAALLTGRLPVRSGLYGERIAVYFPGDPGGLPPSEVTLAERLREHGYRTALFGKWHLGDRPEAWPTRHGFDEWEGIPYSNDMDWELGPSFEEVVALMAQGRGDEVAAVYAERRKQYFEPRSEYWNVPYLRSRRELDASGAERFADEELERSPDQSQLTQRATARALAFLEERGADGEPFFLYVPYSMPHTPIFPSEQFAGRSRGGRYGDVIEEIDWSVGQIRQRLVDLDLAQDTLVLFTSDNGPWLAMGLHGGSPGALENGKGTTFEGGMRVPAIFWQPGSVPAGTSVHDLGSTLDLTATIISWAGLPVADDVGIELDSYDLSDALHGNGPSRRLELPFYRQGELRAYRQGRFKIHFVTEGAYSMPPQRTEHEIPLLFDLAADPGERHDLSAGHPEIVEQIKAAARAHQGSFARASPLFDARLAMAAKAPEQPSR